MKTVAIAVAIVALATIVHAAPKDEYRSWNECLAELNATNAELQEPSSEKHSKFHCFEACRYRKEGILVNDELNKDAIGKALFAFTSKISEAEFSEMYDSCLARVKHLPDICELTKIFSYCIHDGLAKAGV